MNTSSGNEIVTICVGNCGIYTGAKYYETIMDEHHIHKNGTFTGNTNQQNDILLIDKINTYFKHTTTTQYSPRAIFIDTDKNSINQIFTSPFGSLLNKTNLITTDFSDSSIIFPKGHYTQGTEIIDNIMNKIRQEIEICDYYQGFNMMHSLGGGIGSGLGSLILIKMTDNYPDKVSFVYSVYPSITRHSKNHLTSHNANFEIYNSILSTHQLIENCWLNFPIFNHLLFDICHKQCNIKHPTYDDINWLISLILSGVTSPIRFHSETSLCNNLRSMYSLVTVFPRLHFLGICHSPFWSNNTKYFSNVTRIINNSIYNLGNVSKIRPEDGKYMNISLFYRSNDEKSVNKMNMFASELIERITDDFVQWMPNNFSSCKIKDGNSIFYEKYTPIMATSIANTTAIKGIYQELSAQFSKLYKRNAYLFWYKREGMDEMEFKEADKNIRDLVSEYQDKQDSYISNVG
eukprot:48005_1